MSYMPSSNPYSINIIKSGIFKKIENFYDLENRIIKCGNIGNRGVETTKGDIFEVFIEALLSVNKKYQKEFVYPSNKTPSKIKIKLGLNLKKQEMGFDGVYEHNNKLSTYQVKYRNKDNSSLTWKELSTFIGVSEKAYYRHLFTNIDSISHEFLSKNRVRVTSRKDLTKLKKTEFKEIENWLHGKRTKIIKHSPEAYQRLAIKNILKELNFKDRTTAILACGTGKTNIALWTYEKLNPKCSIVFVPSIALIKQIRADWLEQTKFQKINTIQICSFKETSQREDELKFSEIDIDFDTTTDPKVLKNFLKTKSNYPKIIFCTYQSSKIIHLANKNYIYDFAVFDEAHRTARISTRKKKEITGFNLPLYNKFIKIKKRLFLTATRRISNPNKIYNTGDPEITLSMENESLYGKICHSLSFKEAAKLGCIAKFRIILSYVTSDELDKKIRNKASTIINGIEIKTDQVAKQIALKKAIEKYKINKVFTFHNKVPVAKSFCSPNLEGLVNHLPSFYTNSIDGKMKLEKRELIMESFKNSKKAVLSNARCLIEGIDVPSVQMVAFLDNKNSEIDIVQAAGRALRNRNLNKKYGYILIPVFIEKNINEKISDALERTNFENIAQILKAMKEHDSEIAQIINQYVFEKKQSKGFRNIIKKRINSFIEGDDLIIPKELLLEKILNKSFSYLSTKWDEMIYELKKFKDKHGHMNVQYYQNKKLSRWIEEVRRRNNKNQLFIHQINELKELGFLFDDPRITIKKHKNLYPISVLSKKLNISEGVLKRLSKLGFLNKIGIGKAGSGRISDLYEYETIERLRKKTKVDFFDQKNTYTISNISKSTNLDPNIIKRFIKEAKIKPLGTAISPGASGEKLGTTVYRLISKKEICKFYDCLVNPPKNFNTLSSLSNFVVTMLNCKAPNNLLKDSLKRRKVKPIGKYFTNSGIQNIYKSFSIKELKEIVKPYSFQTKNLISASALAKKCEIDKTVLKKYFIDTKLIKPLARCYTHSVIGEADFFSNDINIKFLEKKCKFKLKLPKGYILKSNYKKKLKISQNLVNTIFDKLSIKPKGKVLSSYGITEYYDTFSEKKICKLLKCDFIVNPNQKKLFTIGGACLQFKRRYKDNIAGHTLSKYIELNKIKPFGYGVTNSPNIEPFYDIDILYKKIIKPRMSTTV